MNYQKKQENTIENIAICCICNKKFRTTDSKQKEKIRTNIPICCSYKCKNIKKAIDMKGERNHFFGKKHSKKTKDILHEYRFVKGFSISTGYFRYGKTRKLIHRVLMEDFIGRKLLKSEIIHHKDGNKLNNKIENLMIMTRSEHVKLHHRQGDFLNKNKNKEK